MACAAKTRHPKCRGKYAIAAGSQALVAPFHACAGADAPCATTAQAEPSARAQLWRTARTLLIAFCVVSGLGALVEERGLARGILNNPDMRPQLDTKTKFADVKGVDEAKVCMVELEFEFVLTDGNIYLYR